jgi:hypothetical protein
MWRTVGFVLALALTVGGAGWLVFQLFERGRHYIFARLPFPRFLARACLSSKAQCPAVTGRRDTVASSQGPAGRSSRRELHSGDQPAFFFLPPPPIAARQRELTLLWLLCIQAVSC